MKQELNLYDYIGIIVRHKWIIIPAALITTIVTVMVQLSKPPVYDSSATMVIQSSSIGPIQYWWQYEEMNKPPEYFQAIIRSRAFHKRFQNLLKDSLEVTGHGSFEEAMTTVQGVFLSASEYEDFLTLHARAGDPKMAYLMAKTATIALKERCQEIDKEEVNNTAIFIEEQKKQSLLKLEEAERSIHEFKDKTKIFGTDEDGGMLSELARLENQLTSIQTEKQLALANLKAYEARLSQIQGQKIKSPSINESPDVIKARDEIAQLEKEKDVLTQSAGPNNNQLQNLQERIEQKKKALVRLLIASSDQGTELSNDGSLLLWKNLQESKISEELNVFVLQNREKYYQQLIRNFKRDHPDMTEHAIELMSLQRSHSVAENLYNYLLQQGEEAKIQAASSGGGIQVIDSPAMPGPPIPVNTTRNIMMGTILGLGLGLGLALLREYLDNSLRTQEEVIRVLGLSFLGSVPAFETVKPGIYTSIKKVKRKKKQTDSDSDENPGKKYFASTAIISRRRSKDPIVEAYRSIRSNLQFANVDKSLKSILVTSPSPGDGKTVTAANLAISFALLGQKVILVDTDLRKPMQHTLFNIPNKPGLSEMIIGNLPMNHVAHQVEIESLRVIPSGKVPPNPAEIIASLKMTEIIHLLTNHGDLIIYDTPPMGVVTDALILGTKIDGVLMVVRQGVTNRHTAQDVIEHMQKAKISSIGVIFNCVRTFGRYGYYHYYHKGYYE